MNYASTSMVTAALVLAACGGGDPKCAPPLVEDPVRGACACPPGSTPTGDGESCLFDDGGTDDAGMRDGGPLDAMLPDAGPLPDAPRTWYPWNGYRTGSVHGAANGTLRPTFEWDAVADATDYQIQLDDSCTSPGFAECAFDSPELDERSASTVFRPSSDLAVSMTAPVGRRYYWRVRGCRGEVCGDWSRVMYLNVGRTECDFNGDGYGDLAAGRSGVSASVQLNVGGRIAAAVDADWPYYVYRLACGDADGDGFEDLALLGELGELGAERTRIHRGGTDGVAFTPTHSLPATGSFLGGGLALFDADGDGLDDLFHSDLGLASEAGVTGGVRVYHAPLSSGSRESLLVGEVAGDQLGHDLAGGEDLDGDGVVDLVVGGRGVFVCFWGPLSNDEVRTTRVTDPNPEREADFGAWVSVRRGSIAVGGGSVSSASGARGMAHLYEHLSSGFRRVTSVLGSDTGLAAMVPLGDMGFGVTEARTRAVVGTLELGAIVRARELVLTRAGELSSTIDVDGDGVSELLVGDYSFENADGSEGAVLVVRGTAPWDTLQVVANGTSDRFRFGEYLAR